MASKNNPKNRAASVAEVPFTQPNYYGFNSSCWASVLAENEEQAEQMIRRELGLNKSHKLTVKPL